MDDSDKFRGQAANSSGNRSLPTTSSNKIGAPFNKFLLDDYLWIYFSPCILLFGLIGNILTILVITRKRYGRTNTKIYLLTMAIFDTLVLVSGITPEWLAACEFIVLKETHPVSCQLEKFVFYTAGDTSIWVLCAFTVDRFIAVCFPLKKKDLCVKWQVWLSCIGIFLLASAKNLHVFWTRGIELDEEGRPRKVCGQPADYEQFEVYIRPWLAFAVISVLPFCVLILCNCLIIRTLLHAHRMRSESSSSADKSFLQTTAMCLSVSFTFLICITPSIVLLIGKPYWKEEVEEGSTRSVDRENFAYDVAKAVNNQLMFVNHSINFCLYCLTGKNFRRQLLITLGCAKDMPPGSSKFGSLTPTASVSAGKGNYCGPRHGGGGGTRGTDAMFLSAANAKGAPGSKSPSDISRSYRIISRTPSNLSAKSEDEKRVEVETSALSAATEERAASGPVRTEVET